MTIETLTEFFMWGSILGWCVMVLTGLMWLVMKDFGRRMHHKLFGISPQVVDIGIYAYLGLLKVALLVFFFIPWIALLIIGSDEG